MAEDVEADRKIMHPEWLWFPSTTEVGDRVQVQLDWLDNAAAGAMRKKLVGDTPTLRILELAVPSDSLDFHLSFKASGGYAQQAHFCIRRDALGQNACLYWFYSIIRRKDGKLAWSWEGCAGQGDSASLRKHRVPGIQYGTTAGRILDDLLKSLTSSRHVLEQHGNRWTLRGP